MLDIQQLDSAGADFEQQLQALVSRVAEADRDVEATVREIIAAVRNGGDAALLGYTRRLDDFDCARVADLEIAPERLQQARDRIPDHQRGALQAAAERIRSFHERQCEQSWRYTDDLGVVLGQQITALDRVGLYVPGGRAAYPSSVLMNALPARVAGVRELIMVVPAPGGIVNDMVLAAAAIAGVDRVFPRPSPVSIGFSVLAAPRPSPRSPTAPPAYPGWTRSSARATAMWRRPNAWYSGRWEST